MPRRSKAAWIAAATLVSVPAQAAERHRIDLPRSTLGEAAILLGKQTGSSIGISDQSLAASSVEAVNGQMSTGQALDRLLANRNARAIRIPGDGWKIVRYRRTAAPPSRQVALASAPTTDSSDDNEIIVTASKRDLPLGTYPGAVEIVEGYRMSAGEAAGGTSTLLTRIASLSSTHVGSGRNKLFVRAIADSSFAGPTQATTGQYLGDMRLNYAAPDPDLRLYDMAAVEVLEGPQGTLYGAGSLGGIIRLVPNAPNLLDFGGMISSGASATEHGNPSGDAAATLNLPIVSGRVGARVTAYASHEGGYIDDPLRGLNNVNGVDVRGARGVLRFVPDENWTIDLTGLYQRTIGDDAQYASRDVGRLERESAVRQNYGSYYTLANAKIERDWGDISFVSTTGFVNHKLTERYDATQTGGSPTLFLQRTDTELFSTENRLSRDLHDGLGWLIGFSYLNSQSDIRRTLGSVDGVAPSTGVSNSLSEWTLFGEASLQPIRSIIFTAGGRLTGSRLKGRALDPMPSFNYSFTALAQAEEQASRSETIFLPSLGLVTNALPGVTFYLRYQQGFRPGGLAVDDFRVQRFRNDRIATIEAGVRHGIPGKSPIALTASVAYADWRNIQADIIDRQGLPTTSNIGDGRIYTFEGRIAVAPLRGLTLDLSAIYNDSLLSQPAPLVRNLRYEGDTLRLPNVANLGGRIAVDYRTLIGRDLLTMSASGRYVGKSRLGVGPIYGREQGDYVDTALTAAYEHGPFRISATLTNILDDTGNRFALGTPFDLEGDDYTPMHPRTVRLGFDFAF